MLAIRHESPEQAGGGLCGSVEKISGFPRRSHVDEMLG